MKQEPLEPAVELWDGLASHSCPLSVLPSVGCKAAEEAQGSQLKEGVNKFWGHKLDLGRSSPLRHMGLSIRMQLRHLENSVLHSMNSLLQK